jgi:hypothetical protein
MWLKLLQRGDRVVTPEGRNGTVIGTDRLGCWYQVELDNTPPGRGRVIALTRAELVDLDDEWPALNESRL